MTAFWLKCYNNISWFCVFLWVQNNKIPCTSLTRPYSPVFKIYSESDPLLHFRCYYCGLWKKPTDFSSSSWVIAITSSLLAAVSTFAFLLNLHASRSFQNAGQFMSHPLLTQVQHPRPFLTHSCLPLLPRAPCAVPLRKRMEVLEEDFHELQALIGIPALVPGCLLYSSRS